MVLVDSNDINYKKKIILTPPPDRVQKLIEISVKNLIKYTIN